MPKCVNCGNENEMTLWDEGDTIYCSECYHRTRKEDLWVELFCISARFV